MDSVHVGVWIRAVHGRFREILEIPDFRRMGLNLGTFRAQFLCSSCAARTGGDVRGVQRSFQVTRRACL